jgi:hypothetical protein
MYWGKPRTVRAPSPKLWAEPIRQGLAGSRPSCIGCGANGYYSIRLSRPRQRPAYDGPRLSPASRVPSFGSLAPPPASPASGAIKASTAKPVVYSRRRIAALPKTSTLRSAGRQRCSSNSRDAFYPSRGPSTISLPTVCKSGPTRQQPRIEVWSADHLVADRIVRVRADGTSALFRKVAVLPLRYLLPRPCGIRL